MGTDKRERQKANRALKHQQEMQAAARRKTFRKVAIGVAAVAALVLFVWIASTVVSDDEPSTPATVPATSPDTVLDPAVNPVLDSVPDTTPDTTEG